MATYRDRSREQAFMLPVHLGDQLQPGTFEHTIDYLVDNEMVLSILESRATITTRQELRPTIRRFCWRWFCSPTRAASP